VKAGEPLFTLRGDTMVDGLPRSSIEHAAAAGVREELQVREGQQVREGEVLGAVRLTGTAILVAYFDAATARTIARGAAVKIVLDDFPDEQFSGIVEGELALAPGSERRGRVPVRIRLTGGEPVQQRLNSGMAAKITIRRRAFID
jgi:multidrug resistance efflux pump